MQRNAAILAAIIIVFSLTLAIFYLPLGSSDLRQSSPIDENRIQQNMEAQVNLGPRIPGTQASINFGNWVNETVPNGWEVQKQEWVHLGITLRNYLITTGDNSFPEYLVGAHYDSRKVADQDPENPTQPVPGANDGASGIAGQIELMYTLPTELRDNIGFVMFDGEDQGFGGIDGWSYIVGSEYFVDQLSQQEVDTMKIFLLLDMIGDDDLTMYQEGYSSDVFVDEIWSLADTLGYSNYFIDEVGYSLIDDHRPFLDVGIPSVDLIDFQYPEWHTTQDDMDHVSAESVAIVTDVAYEWLIDKMNEVDITTLSSIPDTSKTALSDFTTTEANFTISPVIILVPFLIKKFDHST